MNRCEWCMGTEKMMRYHDAEWGAPLFDDRKLFEFLMLEVLQCGLSWNLILERREVFQSAFADFDIAAVARLNDEDAARILEVPGMLRSPRKIAAVIHNARLTCALIEEFGSLSGYLWGFTGGKTVVYPAHAEGALPAKTALSEKIAAALKKRGYKYLGAVTVYAFMQSCGMVNDHVRSCDMYAAHLHGREILVLNDDAALPETD